MFVVSIIKVLSGYAHDNNLLNLTKESKATCQKILHNTGLYIYAINLVIKGTDCFSFEPAFVFRKEII